VRGLEFDLHTESTPHEFKVFHTDKVSNSQCSPLAECLKVLVAFQRALPQHDPVAVTLELKELIGDFFGPTNTPTDLDVILERYLAPYLFRPRDILETCGGAGTVRECLKSKGWPPIEQIRGKFLFNIIGNYNAGLGNNCLLSVVHNRRAWVEYATQPGGIAARSAFLMESPWATSTLACQERVPQSLVDQAVAASAFVQYEGGTDGLESPQTRQWLVDNLIVRADIGGNNQPKLSDQKATVAAGASLIQNDYPWYAFNDGTPLRPGIPIHPEQTPSGMVTNEPGHRLLFLAKGEPANITLPFTLNGAPSTHWETFVSNTRPTTDSASPNPHHPRGVGCIYARSADQGNGVRVCRATADGHWNASKPVGEDVIVTVETAHDGSTSTSTYYSSNWDTTGKGGELLRLDVSQTTSGGCVQMFSTEFVINDEPQWQALQKAACFNVPLTDQGLAAHDGDVLFVDTKMSQATAPSAPASATTSFDPNSVSGESYDVQNLSFPSFPPNQ
jgi:hypothetical protein